MENFILDSFGATIKLTIFLCMIVIFIVKSMQFYMKQHEFWSMQVKLLYILFISDLLINKTKIKRVALLCVTV